MGKLIFILFSITLLSISFVQQASATDPLLQQNDLTYIGAFRVPQTGTGCSAMQYGGYVLAYNQQNNSLFITTNGTNSGCEYVGEITIPTPACIDGSGKVVSCTNYSLPLSPVNAYNSKLPVSSFLQTPVDITEGHSTQIQDGGYTARSAIINVNGLLVYNGELIGDTKPYYDAGGAQQYSHFTHSLNVGTSSFGGYYALAPNGTNDGRTAGPMCSIPSSYQAQLGGDILTGVGIGGSGNGNANSELACFISFYGNDLKSANLPPNTVTAHTLTLYDQADSAESLPNDLSVTNPYSSYGDKIYGFVFPDGTRSILAFGTHGEQTVDGHACYGPGTESLPASYSDGCPGGVGTCQESKRLKYITGKVTSGTFTPGEKIVQSGTGASGTFERIDSTYGLEILASSQSGTPNDSGTWTGQTSGAAFQPNHTTSSICYDPDYPTAASKGWHTYPYEPYVWAYDVGNTDGTNSSGNTVQSTNGTTHPDMNNLTAVKLGYLKPYQLVPYAVWSFNLPTGTKPLGGVAYDPVHKLIYVAQLGVDRNPYAALPVIQAFKISGTSMPQLSAPVHLHVTQ